MALRSGVPLADAWRGQGKCSTCGVLVEASTGACPPRGEREQAIADRLGFAMVCLACQTPASLGEGAEVRAVRAALEIADGVEARGAPYF